MKEQIEDLELEDTLQNTFKCKIQSFINCRPLTHIIILQMKDIM